MKIILIILLTLITALITQPLFAASIEGTLLMLDDRTPHVAVPVQAIRNGKVIFTTLSDEIGKYQLINLEPGRYQVRCQILGGYVYYRKGKNAVIESSEASSLPVELGKTLKNINFRFAPFKKGTWRTYDTLDGLSNVVSDIDSAPDGVMWFGTWGGAGVSRYDGKEFKNFTTKDGLVSNTINDIYHAPDGTMWFGTFGGVSRYDGKQLVNFTTKDGLASNPVEAIYRDPDGIMWFGTSGGVSRYDGKTFVNFTTEDGLVGNLVYAIHPDSDGMMWFGTGDGGGGVSRYDGKEFKNFTKKDGLADNSVTVIHRDPAGVLWFGTNGGVSRYDGNKFVTLTTQDGLVNNVVEAIHSDPDGVLWLGTHGGVSRYDGKTFVNFTTSDGLANNVVNAIHRDEDGVLWFGTGDYYGYERGGVSRYDERGLVGFTPKDGLASNQVWRIYRDPDGIMWFGTWAGVSRYDGNNFVSFTPKDGLASNRVWAIHRDPDGVMWFGTNDGVSRYDGKRLVNFITKDGLASNFVTGIYRDSDGIMWFSTVDGGVSRYDGKTFVNFTTKDGLVGPHVTSTHVDPDGVLWFGTYGTDDGGVSRYDGKSFVNFTTNDGLVRAGVMCIQRDSDGVMWFGTEAGVSRYDGKEFITLTTEDGLVDNNVWSIYHEPGVGMWFGTNGGGVSCYDGITWTSLDTRDGLAGNTVGAIHQDLDGALWFATDGGVTRYRRSTVPPKVEIVAVTTNQTYRDLDAIPAFTTGTRVTIEYNAIDLKTVPEKRQYRYRLKPVDSDWRNPTKETSFEDFFDKPGDYTFEVQAIDRALNYSQPASVTLQVVPPFYMTAGFFIPTVGLGTILLLVAIISAAAYFKHRRRVRAYERAAAEELQDAREMQMSLMPTTAPAVEGVEIAGKCLSANTVGGDFFDYLEGKQANEISLVIADVTGKGLKGAMNAVMTDGILHTAAEEMEQLSPSSLMRIINNILTARMEQYMNVTMVIGTIDIESKTLTLANAAHHAYPLLLRNGAIQTIKSGGLPLGMRARIEYSEEQFQLASGDVLILMTDGIIEAKDREYKLYADSGRLEEIISQFTEDLSAEVMVEAILNDAMIFGGDKATRDDDMTVIVAKVF